MLGGLGYQWRLQAKQVEDAAEREDEVEQPIFGHLGSIDKQWRSDTRGTFVSMQEDVDHLGARIFLVDYGNGQKVIQFVDPRILL